MIYIRIELWPTNNPSNYRTLGVIKISNDFTGNDEIGNYDVETRLGDAGEPIRTKVRRHVRKRSVLYLLKRAVMGAIREGERRSRVQQFRQICAGVEADIEARKAAGAWPSE